MSSVGTPNTPCSMAQLVLSRSFCFRSGAASATAGSLTPNSVAMLAMTRGVSYVSAFRKHSIEDSLDRVPGVTCGKDQT